MQCVRRGSADQRKAPFTRQEKASLSPSASTEGHTVIPYDQSSSPAHEPYFEDDQLWHPQNSFSQIEPTYESPSAETENEFIQSASILYQISRPSGLDLERPISKSPFDISDPKDQHLLRHFIRTVSRTLSVVHEDATNPFLCLVVPLAGSSKVVMESLLALSAAHLRGVYPEILHRGLSHQSKGDLNLPTPCYICCTKTFQL